MPKKSKYKLKTQNISKEELGLQIARLRKQKGYTQVELAKKMGITQVLISAYERGRIKPGYEIISSFAQALEVTTDELLGLKDPKTAIKKPSLKILKRLNKIEQLPPSQQRALLQTIDNFLKGVQAQQ
jgi:transcriptional regulator with XRE-family HTH domain